MRHIAGAAVLALTAVALAACGAAPQPTTGEPASGPGPAPAAEIRVAGVGFATPESVLHDPAADVYLVSNINGSPLDRDDNGFISRLAPDGTVLELKWIDGAADGVTLNAPKGLAIIDDMLYVADIDVVRRFHRESGEPQGEVAIPDASFVNDLAVARDGWLIVSDSGVVFGPDGTLDTGTAAVYLIEPGDVITTVATGPSLERPNGVLDSAARDGLVVVPFGGSTVYLLDEDGERLDLAVLPAGGLDGVVETGDGRLLVSSWGGSAVYEVGATGAVRTLAENLPAPADLGYDAARDLVLVPLFNDDAVVLLPTRARR
ncbi:MAG: hypothetical protein MUE90_11445 [Thermoanaerobaculales bacterium]|jgi:sugar lactone lactonase YvrE|nr:hypothetical protein [Thermoanaerobaculales bacterium]